jgi:polysaccharide export outer membrane protein
MRHSRVMLSICAAAVLLTGCVTPSSRRADILNRLLQERRTRAGTEENFSGGGKDSPDTPDSGLPPSPGGSIVTVVPGTHIPAGGNTGTSRITIQPATLVQVSVIEDSSLDGSFSVNEIGAIDLGYVGPIILMNKSESEAAGKIGGVLRTRGFKKATVKVKILRASYDKVKIDGSVSRPGLVRIEPGGTISLKEALLRVGGIKVSARAAEVRVIRQGLEDPVYKDKVGELYTLIGEDGTAKVPEVFLRNNDVASVFSSSVQAGSVGGQKDVTVLGEVNRPGIYRFGSNEPCTMMHLLFKIGQFPAYANLKKVRLIRPDGDDGEDESIINAQKILEEGDPDDNLPLEDGDRIIIPARRLSIF